MCEGNFQTRFFSVSFQIEGVNNVEFQLRVSLFDLAYHQFFGRQWAGQYSELHGVGGASKPKLRLSQVSLNLIFIIQSLVFSAQN